MPPLLTANAVIMCSHGGKVTPVPTQEAVLIEGTPVLCGMDLTGAPVVGCTLPPTPTTKPCTTAVVALPGSWSPTVLVAGRPPLLATATGITDAVPPGSFAVLYPGQITVEG